MTERKVPQEGSQTDGPEAESEASPALDSPMLLINPSPERVDPGQVSETVVDAGNPDRGPKRQSGFIGLLIGGVLAAGAGFVLAKYEPGGWPLQDTSALQTEIQSQAKDIEQLKAALTTSGGGIALEQRLAALETAAPIQTPVDLKSLQDRVALLEAELPALKTASAGGDVAEELRQIQGRLKALELGSTLSPEAIAATDDRVKEAEIAAAASKAEAERMATKAADTAILSYISDALTNGSAFSDQLAQLSVPAPDVLISVSETGVPTVATLQGTFPEAARKALDAALRADMGSSWAQRAATFLRTQTGARSLTPREGSDPDAILSRAEAALTSGDLQTAMTEIAGLPKEAQEPMAEWLELAQKWLASTQAFAKLSAILDQ